MKKLKSFETFLPMFEGFYQSSLEFENIFDSEIYGINEDRKENNLNEINIFDFDINNKKYESDIAKKVCKVIEDKLLNELNLNVNIIFQELLPLVCYVSNGSVYISIEFDNANLKQLNNLIKLNKEYLKETIKNKYTSCGGFISSHSNNINDWLNKNNDEYYLNSSHKLGAILEMLLSEEIEYSDIIEEILSNNDLDITNYLNFTYEELQTFVMVDGEFKFNECRLMFDETGKQIYS